MRPAGLASRLFAFAPGAMPAYTYERPPDALSPPEWEQRFRARGRRRGRSSFPSARSRPTRRHPAIALGDGRQAGDPTRGAARLAQLIECSGRGEPAAALSLLAKLKP